MAVFSGAMPVLPGKLDELRAFGREVMGARRSDFDEYWKRQGVTRGTCSIQELPNGRVQAVVWFERDDLKAGAESAEDSSEFAVWFRGRVKEITGIDLEPRTDPPELVIDWKA
jgi:hypothetical protein